MAVSDALIATAQESNRSWRIEKAIARRGLVSFSTRLRRVVVEMEFSSSLGAFKSGI